MSELLPCPFCASTRIDAEGWMCNDGRKGPACDDCGASAESVETWNSRPEEAKLRTALRRAALSLEGGRGCDEV